jgi:archaeal type IV pilus assembly protein PilA
MRRNGEKENNPARIFFLQILSPNNNSFLKFINYLLQFCHISSLMKAWGKIRSKRFFSSKPTSEAVTPIVGSLLMLLILFALAGVAASSFFNSAADGSNYQPPVVRISLESCEGGLYDVDSKKEKVIQLEENRIVLVHEGGDSLPFDTISIRISGYGNSHRPAFEPGKKGHLKGNISVLYLDLSPGGKNSTCYVDNNKATLEDGFWDVGERLVLCGQDSAVGTVKSSVKVSVDGDDSTSDNYGFKAGSDIIVKVIDIKSSNVIVEQRAIVKHVEG